MDFPAAALKNNRTQHREGSGNDSEDDAQSGDRHSPNGSAAAKAVKRACNDCRQQKLRCDVVQSPFTPCTRCRRLKKDCKVESFFKRVGKRDKYLAMQKEIDDLRRQLQQATAENQSRQQHPSTTTSTAVAPLPTVTTTQRRHLGDVKISGEDIDGLYREYFSHYHAFLPFLDSQQTPDQYFNTCPLLGWAIVMVGARRYRGTPKLLQSLSTEFTKLLWNTVADVPQPYYVVKAICITCFWPLPTSSNVRDPSFQLSGIMMQIALQNGLHLHFKSEIEFGREGVPTEQRDRLLTWIAFNVVAQSSSGFYGLPPHTIYDWVLAADLKYVSLYNLPKDLLDQLRISRFFNDMTKGLYCCSTEPNGLIPQHERFRKLQDLQAGYSSLEHGFGSHISATNRFHLLATCVQLNCFAFFLPLGSPGRDQTFLDLYNSACTFLRAIIDYETSNGTLLEHCSSFIGQSIFSAIFAMLKLLNSSVASKIDFEHGTALFNGMILATRRMSIQNDDLPERFAIRVPQLWKVMRTDPQWSMARLDPLVLRIDFRMSWSHVDDCMWAWRVFVRDKGDIQSQQQERSALSSTSTKGPDIVRGEINHAFQAAVGTGETLFPTFDPELDIFGSMDWMMGDWAGMEFPPYDLNATTNFPQ
ncbi:hypothetical protein B0J14DRAFT_360528 [Halenospora varia]|nr:hypothetical protein B0J14DRAFT_360528 [Halenospora varia]